ncbi:MAG: hypothetical protein ACTSRS_05410 [Candidatus Helarchaeota archaeon]
MPNRRKHDHIGQFKSAGIAENDITKIINDLDKLIERNVSSKDIEIIVKKIVEDKQFRGDFLKNPALALKQVGMDPQPSP